MTHPIPDVALDEDIAVLGKKGGGKTFTSKGIVERLLDLKRRVLILDPLGVWAGLRTSADGESPGYPVAVFGGTHADLPLDPAAAEILAKIIASENLPAVLDLSDLSKTAQQGFLLKFLHELRRANSEALTIVLEEADVFAPQQPMGDDSKALHGEIDWIARRGRFKGFRLITITQRPARLSKDVLTQCSTLIAHRLPAPQDREAVKAWVDGNGDRDKAREVFDTLATLAVGEGWVYAPEHDILHRVKFPPIKTLDTSATPKAGERRVEPKTLAQIDVSAVRAALDAAKTEESPVPKSKTRDKPAPDTAALEQAEKRGYARGLNDWRKGFDKEVWAAATQIAQRMTALAGDMAVLLTELKDAEAADKLHKDIRPTPVHVPTGTAMLEAVSPAEHKKRNPTKRQPSTTATDPILAAALSVWPARLTWPALASMCGRKARGGHFNSVRKRLLDSGAVRMDGDLVTPTEPPETPEGAIPADLLEQNLPQPAAKMFAAIRRNPGITIIGLATVLGMQPRGGHWNFGVATLRRNGLIMESGDALEVPPSLLESK